MKTMKNLTFVAVIAIFGAIAFTACDPEPTTYTVTFNTNGGSTVASQTIEKGEKATKPADPTKADYTFAGWYKDNDTFANAWDFATNTVTANVTLYAKWVKEYANIDEPNASVTFDEEDCSFIIKGVEGEKYTDTEWENIISKIKQAFDLAHSAVPADLPAEYVGIPLDSYQGQLADAMALPGLTIVVKTFTGANAAMSYETSGTTTSAPILYVNKAEIEQLSNPGRVILAMPAGLDASF